MITRTRLSTRAATHEDGHKLANLIHFEAFVHRHLDYRPPLDWVGQHPFFILEKNDEVVGALACPPDPPRVAWVRLFAVQDIISVESAWDRLWSCAYTQLKADENLRWAAAVPIHQWFISLLKKSQFEETHRVVTLRWEGATPPQAHKGANLNIRPMNLDDLKEVSNIDQDSFIPVWQNSQTYLEFAFRQAVIATVAEEQGKLVGYQISTSTPIGGHLARLAVHPELQCQGIGYAILQDLVAQFSRRGARVITVNTQDNNEPSLILYQKAGFQLTSESYPTFQLSIHPDVKDRKQAEK